MLTEETRTAVTEFATSLLSLRPLAEAGHPIAVPLDAAPPRPGCLAVADVAATVAERLNVPLAPVWRGSAAPAPGPTGGSADLFARIVPDRLGSCLTEELGRVPVGARAEVGGVAAAVADGGFDRLRAPSTVSTPDGAELRTYAAGQRGRPAIVIASACGMPGALCEPWMRFLARDHFVVTWETRGLFGRLGAADQFDRLGHDPAAQAADLLTVMDSYELPTAHLMGLCGGAVLALRAAGERPERVSSLSLWHGDYELGAGCPKTDHQHNLKALMEMAVQSRASAAVINAALCQTAMAAVPVSVAHLVVYPYVNAELFYRYCALTGSIMSADVASLLGAVRQPALVVTSEDDHTAHPAGSHRVAAALPAAQLRVEPHGDHISVFSAAPRLRRILTDFLGSLPG
ncbi:MAG TPA: alpha/beta hydrolase [Micromonosporaceae bacterium]|nr:alpha/beta hydrolase [Micromonosporaceae bacterium]